MTQQLGKLERISDLRRIWESEATHFTPWLAREDNLALLADTIGLDLELEAQEKVWVHFVQISFAAKLQTIHGFS